MGRTAYPKTRSAEGATHVCLVHGRCDWDVGGCGGGALGVLWVREGCGRVVYSTWYMI